MGEKNKSRGEGERKSRGTGQGEGMSEMVWQRRGGQEEEKTNGGTKVAVHFTFGGCPKETLENQEETGILQ